MLNNGHAWLQTGQYSTQIFSLAVLLSSMFVYNQMGGIDEAALDRLSLVTEMTKHIRVRAGSAAGMQECRKGSQRILSMMAHVSNTCSQILLRFSNGK